MRSDFTVVGASRQRLDLQAVVLVLLGMVVAVFYIQPIASILDRTQLNYNEGWNAYYAQAAIRGGALYPPPDALAANSYPPLSFYVVGGLGRLVGDDIIAGRFVAIISLLVVAANILSALRSVGATRIDSWFAALLVLAYAGGRFPSYVAMNDPQWFAHALMTSGLVVFLRRPVRPALVGLLAPALMVAGIFTKQNSIALPLAILIWCAIHDRSELWRWLIVGAALTAAVFALFYWRLGADFIPDMLSARPYSILRLLDASRKYLSPLLFLVAGGIWLLVLDWRRPAARLVLLWAGLGIIIGVAFLGGSGVNYNTLFDPCIALCVAAGLLVSRLRTSGVKLPIVLITMLLATLPVLTMVPRRINLLFSFIEHRSAQRAQGQADIALLAHLDGRVACEMLALCYWAGKDFEIDFFNTEQKILMGIVRPDVLARKFANRTYAAVVLTTNAPVAEQLPWAVMTRLYANYRPTRVSANGWTILVADGPPHRDR